MLFTTTNIRTIKIEREKEIQRKYADDINLTCLDKQIPFFSELALGASTEGTDKRFEFLSIWIEFFIISFWSKFHSWFHGFNFLAAKWALIFVNLNVNFSNKMHYETCPVHTVGNDGQFFPPYIQFWLFYWYIGNWMKTDIITYHQLLMLLCSFPVSATQIVCNWTRWNWRLAGKLAQSTAPSFLDVNICMLGICICYWTCIYRAA